MKRKRGGKRARRVARPVKRRASKRVSRTSKLSRKKKKFNLLDFFKGKYFAYAAVGVFLVFAFALVIANAGQRGITTRQVEDGETGTELQIPEPAQKVFMIVLGKDYSNLKGVAGQLGEGPLGNVAGPIIIYIMVWLILFFSFSYVFGTFLFKDEKYRAVPWFVGFGMAVIAANFGIITRIIAWMAAGLSVFGSFSVFAAMGVAFVAFFLVTFFNSLFKIRQAKQEARSAKAGGIKAAAGISVAKEMAKAAAEGE